MSEQSVTGDKTPKITETLVQESVSSELLIHESVNDPLKSGNQVSGVEGEPEHSENQETVPNTEEAKPVEPADFSTEQSSDKEEDSKAEPQSDPVYPHSQPPEPSSVPNENIAPSHDEQKESTQPSASSPSSDDVRRWVALPFDQSINAERAFHYYRKFLHKPEYTVLLIHIHTMPQVTFIEENGEIKVSGNWKDKVKQSIEEVKKLIEKYSKMCRSENINFHVVTQSKSASIGADINKIVQDYGAFWIVIARRGLNFIRRTICGSVCDHLLYHSKVALTLVPSDFEPVQPHEDPASSETKNAQEKVAKAPT